MRCSSCSSGSLACAKSISASGAGRLLAICPHLFDCGSTAKMPLPLYAVPADRFVWQRMKQRNCPSPSSPRRTKVCLSRREAGASAFRTGKSYEHSRCFEVAVRTRFRDLTHCWFRPRNAFPCLGGNALTKAAAGVRGPWPANPGAQVSRGAPVWRSFDPREISRLDGTQKSGSIHLWVLP
jgi:hypothetical protein